jgi:hypothetical protein
MSKQRRAVALLVVSSVLAVSIVAEQHPVAAQPPQPMGAVPPIIGNTTLGVFRDLDGPLCTNPLEHCSMPAAYYPAIDAFEDAAIRKVLEDHDLPLTDYDAVKGWGRDAIRTQEFLDLMAIIKKPAAERTSNEALVHDWFRQMYQINLIGQAQAGLDEYLRWSGLTLETIDNDPEPIIPGSSDSGYCNFRPPGDLDGGFGLFNGTYNPTQLPQCNGPGGLAQCQGLATGCPVPWPTVEQFQQWGRYLAQKDFLEDPILMNLAMEASVGIGLAATMAAAGVSTAVARAYLAVPTTGSGLFSRVFPYAARAAVATGSQIAIKASETAARVSAGVIRAGAIAFVVGTVISALVTIALEAWLIIEHQQIPVKLKQGLADAKATLPDLSAVAEEDGGIGALLTTFLATTAIDVDPDCQLPTPDNPYSKFPCSHAPAPPASTATDDVFYVTTDEGGSAQGSLRSSIYTVNPIDSGPAFVGESVRLSGDGWFVATKFDANAPANLNEPTDPGATLQTLRLYYRDADGKSKVAERFVDDTGTSKFIVTSTESGDLGPCATPGTTGSTSSCVTDTIYYVEPDGTKASARLVAFDSTLPQVHALVPARAIAGQPITLSATAESLFFPGPYVYRWTLPGGTPSKGPTWRRPTRFAGRAAGVFVSSVRSGPPSSRPGRNNRKGGP